MNEITPLKASDVAQTMIFKVIWSRLPSKSFISGLWLRTFVNTPLWMNCFTYILPPDKYRYFKFYMGNVILTTPGERGLYMDGTEEDRIAYALDLEEKSRGASSANWSAVRELEEDLKVLYKKHFPSTRGMFLNYTYTLEDQEKIVGKLNREFWRDFK